MSLVYLWLSYMIAIISSAPRIADRPMVHRRIGTNSISQTGLLELCAPTNQLGFLSTWVQLFGYQ